MASLQQDPSGNIDLEDSTITIHERKKSRSTRTTRVVPMSKQLHKVLAAWVEEKEGGPVLFPEDHRVMRNRIDRIDGGAVSPDEASNHFNQTLSDSK